eukprot:Rhum_TRINITY_DN15440_c7_g1::Rhum_TRINITY_DN15440_c7_g1_i3::g.157159::m.157159
MKLSWFATMFSAQKPSCSAAGVVRSIKTLCSTSTTWNASGIPCSTRTGASTSHSAAEEYFPHCRSAPTRSLPPSSSCSSTSAPTSSSLSAASTSATASTSSTVRPKTPTDSAPLCVHTPASERPPRVALYPHTPAFPALTTTSPRPCVDRPTSHSPAATAPAAPDDRPCAAFHGLRSAAWPKRASGGLPDPWKGSTRVLPATRQPARRSVSTTSASVRRTTCAKLKTSCAPRPSAVGHPSTSATSSTHSATPASGPDADAASAAAASEGTSLLPVDGGGGGGTNRSPQASSSSVLRSSKARCRAAAASAPYRASRRTGRLSMPMKYRYCSFY